MFFSKLRWRALMAIIAMGAGAPLLAPAHAAVDDAKKPRSAVKASGKPAAKKPTPSSGARKRSARKAAAVAGTGVAAPSVAAAKPSEKALPRNAEARLLSVIDLVERQQLTAALQAAAKLTSDIPNFQAAQLVYADLLRFRIGKTGILSSPVLDRSLQQPSRGPAPGAASEVLINYQLPPSSAASSDSRGSAQELQLQLKGLRDELRRRVQGSSELPPIGSIPPEFLQLADSVRHAIAIDASKSRLYLFSNEGGRLRLIADYYVSVGKLGMGKAVEGDQRTPEGVYFIGRQIPGVKLPEFYGKGALTMNYPNDWDKSQGRTGDGIWFHGSPPDQFARLPEASDGCVVLANPDLIALMKTVTPQTPVLMRNSMQWVFPPEKSSKLTADAFLQVMDAWQQAWKTDDQQALSRLYSSAPPIEQAPKARLSEYFRLSESGTRNVSVYAWKDSKGEIRIVDMQVSAQRVSKPLSLRQYWRKTGDRWEIFSEGIRG